MLADDPTYRPRDAAQALSLLGLDAAPDISVDDAPPSLQSAELQLDSDILNEIRSVDGARVRPPPESAPDPARRRDDLPPLKRGFDVRGALESVAGTVVVIVGFLLLLAIAAIAFLAPIVIDFINQTN